MFDKRYFGVILLIVMRTVCLWAGDTATFVDLGFSSDGKMYLFGQYGIQEKTLYPWAELYMVDVPKNEFAPGGRVSYTHDASIAAGQDGSGALYRLISRNTALMDRHGINFLRQGQILYIGADEKKPAHTREIIEFRDFEQGVSYTASLSPTIEGSGASLASSFFITVERVAPNGSKKTYSVGNPQIKRPLISSYFIRKVIIPPQKDAIIFVVEMRKQGNSAGQNIRYMVETLRF